MNAMNSKRFRVFAAIALVVVVLFGWMAVRQTALSDEHMYESVKIGMSRVDVEKLLGKPAYAVEALGRVYYGSTPTIEEWQSPLSMTSISINYSSKNIVDSKNFYPGNNVSVHEP